MSSAILAIIQHHSPLAPPKWFFSIFFLGHWGLTWKGSARRLHMLSLQTHCSGANTACFIREWLQWRASCIREPPVRPRPLNPAAWWPWSWVGSTVCPKLLLPQAEPSKAAGPVYLCSPVGIKGSAEGAHSLPFLQREYRHSESLFCSRPS